jgi:glutathione S-transferase
MVYLRQPSQARDPQKVNRGEAALDHMQNLLSQRSWCVGGQITIADIALLAYTRLAHEGAFDLAGRPAVTAWIARCEKALGLAAAVH